ncbi:hypothetical protein MP638_002736 [Amoeboaphelidium occidentale]|nr:hypothetical protein MP638_002736 [Amoeboaphelidium occidentale]
MSTMPEGNHTETRLLSEAWKKFEEFVAKSSSSYEIIGGNWFSDNIDNYRLNRNEFVSKIRRENFRLNEIRVARQKGLDSFAGLQAVSSKGKTSEKKRVDMKTTKPEFENKTDTGYEHADGQLRSDISPDNSKGATGKSILSSSIQKDKLFGYLLPATPGTYQDNHSKREFDTENSDFDVYPCRKLLFKPDNCGIIDPDSDNYECSNEVQKLISSITNYNYESKENELFNCGSMSMSLDDSSLNYIEDVQLRQVLYLDFLVSSKIVRRAELERSTAFQMLEIYQISTMIVQTRGKTLQEEMKFVFNCYAHKNKIKDTNFESKRINLLTKHICRGKKMYQIMEVLGDIKNVDKYIPADFSWSSAYTLTFPSLKDFLHQLKGHINNLKTRKKDHEEQKVASAIPNSNQSSASLNSGEIGQGADLNAVNLQEFGQEKSSDIPVVHGSANEVKPVLFTKQDSNHNLDLSANMEPSYTVEVINKGPDKGNVEDGIIVKPPKVNSDALNNLKAPSGWLTSDIIETYLEHLAAQLSKEVREDISIILPFAQPIICNHNKTSFSLDKVRLYIEEGRKSMQHGGYRWAVGVLLDNNHWITLVIDFTDCILFELDSISKAPNCESAGRTLTRTVLDVIGDIYQKDFNTRVFPVYQQQNDFDCGVHALINAEGVLRCISKCGKFDESSKLEAPSAADYRNSMIRFYDS